MVGNIMLKTLALPQNGRIAYCNPPHFLKARGPLHGYPGLCIAIYA